MTLLPSEVWGRTLQGGIRRAGHYWLAQCLEVGIVAQAPTRQEAREGLVEAVRLYLEAAEDLEAEGRVVSPIPSADLWDALAILWAPFRFTVRR